MKLFRDMVLRNGDSAKNPRPPGYEPDAHIYAHETKTPKRPGFFILDEEGDLLLPKIQTQLIIIKPLAIN